jgi:predicted nucleic acid-binding protein
MKILVDTNILFSAILFARSKALPGAEVLLDELSYELIPAV